jgi:Trypsin
MPTGNPDYWVELRQAERTLGAGFLVAHRRVLTAAHCVRGLSPNADLTIAPTVGNLVPARLEEIAERADLALIELLKDPYPHIPHPRTSRCRPRDDWFGPYRPSESDPHLSGSVVHDSVDYECGRRGDPGLIIRRSGHEDPFGEVTRLRRLGVPRVRRGLVHRPGAGVAGLVGRR